jgi:Flp pilus assembly protein TadD
MDSNFPLARWWLAVVYEQAGKPDEAITEAQKAASLTPGAPRVLGTLGHAYAVAGKRAQAQEVLAQLKDLSERRYVAPLNVALIYAGLGDKGLALEWLERAYEDHSDRLTWIKTWPQFDSLRAEPRFRELLRRMRIPE